MRSLFLVIIFAFPFITGFGINIIGGDNVNTIGGATCSTSVDSISEATNASIDIKDGTVRTIVGNVYTATSDETVCAVSFDITAKDGAACESNTYHAEIWSVLANGEGGCTNADGCLETQIGSDSDGIQGVGTWSATTVLFENLSASITNGTSYFIGVTHNNAANTGTEATIIYDSGGTGGGTRASTDGDVSGALLYNSSGGLNYEILAQ